MVGWQDRVRLGSRVYRRATGKSSTKKLEEHLFTELVGIQLLLINTLGPILRGELMAAEQVDAVFRQVQCRKAGKAEELLNKRLTRELESRSVPQMPFVCPAVFLHSDA